jgi:hypothetical protein
LTAPGVIALEDIQVDFDEGQATLNFEDVSLFDWSTLQNSLSNGKLLGPATDATMSATLRWRGINRRVNDVDDADNSFGGDFIENRALLTVATEGEDGTTFAGQGDTASKGIFGAFAEIGREENGVFF